MKALVLDRPGSIQTLHLADIPEPHPGPGEVRVRVHATGLNPADYKFAATGRPSWRFPFILGLDVAGVIDALGSDVKDWQIGDRVYYHGDLSRHGGYAEWTVVVAHTIAHLPEGLSFAQAAAIPCAGFTAYQALYRKLHIQEGQTILVHGGAGGVGGFAVQIASHAGLHVISTASPHNFAYVEGLGAAEVWDYHHHTDFPARVKASTAGRGLDAIVDTVGWESATRGLALLAFGGGIACINGVADYTKSASFTKALSLHDIALGGAYLSGDRRAQEDLARIGREFGELVSKKKIDPLLQEVITLEEVPDALTRIANGHVRGKIVAAIL